MQNARTAPTRTADALKIVLDENARVLREVPDSDGAALVQLLQSARGSIFLLGEGRSGLVGRMFAMRLMHLGRRSFVVGETTTPSITGQDVLLALSGSGRTRIVLELAQEAAVHGVTLVAITADAGSPLAQSARLSVVLPAASKEDTQERRSRQFAGSLFEQSALLFTDAVFYMLAEAEGASDAALLARHANLE